MGNRSSAAVDQRQPEATNRSKDEPIQSSLEIDENTRSEANEEEADNEEERDSNYCCETTCCNNKLRDISVNEPISSCLSQRITWSSIFWLASSITLISMTWSSLYFVIGDAMLPDGPIFGLFFLVIASYSLGWALAFVPYLNLPPVFGMLLAGIIFRNTGIYDIHEKIGVLPTSKIRNFCLTFIMLRAGLQLTTTALKKHPVFLIVLALVPCTIEMIVVGISSRYILHYPWSWAFLTGSIVACMSPVVTVNCILALADKGYGEDKGIATLLCTAASIDDVHIASIYSICFSFVFTTDLIRTEWWNYIPGGFRDLLLGLVVGFLLGTFFVFVPHRKAKYVSWYRLGSLILGSLMCTTGASKIAVTGGGYLATVSMSFIATTGWRLISPNFDVKPLRKAVLVMWHFTQPILVGVIGADIDIGYWSARRFGLYVSCILIGILSRSISAILSTYGTNFDLKERIFVALAWLPKGTLQAALAPMAYERAKEENDPERVELAIDVVRISVVAIVFLAPLGAIIMMISGPLLLNKITEEETRRYRYLSYLRMMSQLQPIGGRKRKTKDSADFEPDNNQTEQQTSV